MSLLLVDSRNTRAVVPDTSPQHSGDDLHSSADAHFGVDANSNAASAVFKIPELHVLILSHLSTKDLTHALSVSKVWHKTIYDSLALRRILFLEPVRGTEFFFWSGDVDQRCYSEPFVVQPVVSREREAYWKVVVKPRPYLAAINEELRPTNDYSLCMTLRLDRLSSVPASAFLFQPPVTDMEVYYEDLTSEIRNAEGVTFGVFFQEIRKLLVAVGRISPAGLLPDLHFEDVISKAMKVQIMEVSVVIEDAVLDDSYNVNIAREAAKKAALYAVLTSSGTNTSQQSSAVAAA